MIELLCWSGMTRERDTPKYRGAAASRPSSTQLNDGHAFCDQAERRGPLALPRTTLQQLRRDTLWFWVACAQCLHRKAVEFVPLVIRWGAGATR
jgi:hypothetical protein